MAEHQHHRGGRAIALIDELLRRYPRTPLAETARVERLRILAEQGDLTRMRREGERYLSDYPNGHAREQVTEWLASAPAGRP